MKEKVIEQAWKAMQNAYAPYSKYHVGACVMCHDGTYYLGANIENASYGLTCCAERNALFAAYSAGKRSKDIAAIAIVSDGDRLAYPCGACRQVMIELIAPDTIIYLRNRHTEATATIAELLPHSFDREDLHHV